MDKATVVQVSRTGYRVRSPRGHFISRVISRQKAEQQVAVINRNSTTEAITKQLTKDVAGFKAVGAQSAFVAKLERALADQKARLDG